jgi:hypothetical protein
LGSGPPGPDPRTRYAEQPSALRRARRRRRRCAKWSGAS